MLAWLSYGIIKQFNKISILYTMEVLSYLWEIKF